MKFNHIGIPTTSHFPGEIETDPAMTDTQPLHSSAVVVIDVQVGLATGAYRENAVVDAIHKVIGKLTPNDFYDPTYKTIYSAICELYAMTKDEEFRRPAQRAVNYCISGQDDVFALGDNARGKLGEKSRVFGGSAVAKMALIVEANRDNLARFGGRQDGHIV